MSSDPPVHTKRMNAHLPDCPTCAGTDMVCESHPNRPWGGTYGEAPLVLIDNAGPSGECWCGAPGMPCPSED